MAAADGKARRVAARVRQEAAAMLQKSRRELQIPSRPVTEEEQKQRTVLHCLFYCDPERFCVCFFHAVNPDIRQKERKKSSASVADHGKKTGKSIRFPEYDFGNQVEHGTNDDRMAAANLVCDDPPGDFQQD